MGGPALVLLLGILAVAFACLADRRSKSQHRTGAARRKTVEESPMKNVTATIEFTLIDERGEEIHKTQLDYHGLDEGRVLFIERHLIGALSDINVEASLAAGKAPK